MPRIVSKMKNQQCHIATRVLTNRGILSLLAALIVWAVFAWPTPRYFSKGIPYSASNRTGSHSVQRMVPGDHLQLLYYFWLFKDTVTGHTPWFYNLYEFNTGNDQERYQPDTYYLPFSLFYTAGALLGEQATGWNLAMIITLWLTLYFSWLLVRRSTNSEIIAFATGLLTITLPYIWVSICGGSPAGFAMMWLPLIFLGFEEAGRTLSMRWGIVGGAAVLLASFADLHVFFFGALSIPFWIVIGLLKGNAISNSRSYYLGLCRAIIPGLLISGFGYLILKKVTSPDVATSISAGGRSLAEAAIYSPLFSAVLPWNSGQLFISLTTIIVLFAGLLAIIYQYRSDNRQKLYVYLLLLLAAGLVIILALGTNGPLDGLAFRIARGLIPPYRMIRQPSKIYCLMPIILAVTSGMALSAIVGICARTTKIRRLLLAASLVLGIITTAECHAKIQASICLLDKEQPAYAAIQYDAAKREIPARTLVIPLWPGDSHYSSAYQYYSTIYRLRLVNGYTPSISRDYYDNIFQRWEGVNQGIINSDLITDLLRHNVYYIILHEDLFPEKVSALPANFTLRSLLQHPNLILLRQDGPVWAFAISAAANTNKPTTSGNWAFAFNHYQYKFASGVTSNATIITEPATRGQDHVDLNSAKASATIGPVSVVDENNLRWCLRIKGKGQVTYASSINNAATLTTTQPIDSPAWSWKELPIKSTKRINSVTLTVTAESGQIILDTAQLVSGPWHQLKTNESMTIPAVCFYHAGYTDLQRSAVVLRKLSDKSKTALYSSNLPLQNGQYCLELFFSSPAPVGTVLGEIRVDSPFGRTLGRHTVASGLPTKLHFNVTNSQPICIFFHYRNKADLALSRVTITRDQ